MMSTDSQQELIFSAPNLDMELWVFLPFLCVWNNISWEYRSDGPQIWQDRGLDIKEHSHRKN